MIGAGKLQEGILRLTFLLRNIIHGRLLLTTFKLSKKKKFSLFQRQAFITNSSSVFADKCDKPYHAGNVNMAVEPLIYLNLGMGLSTLVT